MQENNFEELGHCKCISTIVMLLINSYYLQNHIGPLNCAQYLLHVCIVLREKHDTVKA